MILLDLLIAIGYATIALGVGYIAARCAERPKDKNHG